MINTTWLWEGLSEVEAGRIIIKSTETFNKDKKTDFI